jgi:hypothetical protein
MFNIYRSRADELSVIENSKNQVTTELKNVCGQYEAKAVFLSPPAFKWDSLSSHQQNTLLNYSKRYQETTTNSNYNSIQTTTHSILPPMFEDIASAPPYVE